MFFTLPIDGRVVVLSAATVEELEVQCRRLAKNGDVDVIYEGAIIDTSVFNGLLRSQKDFVEVTLAPRVRAPAATIATPTNATNVAVTSSKDVTTEQIPSNTPLVSTTVYPALPQRQVQSNKVDDVAYATWAAQRAAANLRPNGAASPQKPAPVATHMPQQQTPVAISSNSYSQNDQLKSVPFEAPPKPSSIVQTIHASEVQSYPTFVDLRLGVISKLVESGQRVNSSTGFLHIVRLDTKELVVSAEDYEAFRSVLLKTIDVTKQKNEPVLSWRWDPNPAEALISQPPNDTRRQAASQAQPLEAIKSSSASITEYTQYPATRFMQKCQLKVVDPFRGIVGYIPFDCNYPPSYWMLQQHAQYVTAIPAPYLELELHAPDTYEPLAVQSDADVRVISFLLQRGDTVEVCAVDLRL